METFGFEFQSITGSVYIENHSACLLPLLPSSPQGCLFSYMDTHRHRLGPNYHLIPVNCPFQSRARNYMYQRDGFMCIDSNHGRLAALAHKTVLPPPSCVSGKTVLPPPSCVSGKTVLPPPSCVLGKTVLPPPSCLSGKTVLPPPSCLSGKLRDNANKWFVNCSA